jgi:murein DD-endopeptidase MepM/ murein hydrolase activator NlpD
VILGGLAGGGFFGHRHYQLLKSLPDQAKAEKDAAYHLAEIKNQRQQIQIFAKKIDALKARLVELNEFEKKIRIIANMENPDDEVGLFGIGGSKPEDLDTGIELSEKHNSLLREMHDQVEQLAAAAVQQDQSFESLLEELSDQQNLLASTPAITPTKGWITSGFGYRKSPYTERREFHKGIDIAAPKGTPILATANGSISFTGRKGALGKVVSVDHGHGISTRFAHVQKILKKRGEKVKRGDIIALVGNTGRSTGPHVHYEVHVNGIPVNPKKYILD